MPRKRVDPIARFWAKVDKSGECWLWTGGRDSNGYGRFWDGKTCAYAHRFAWEQEHGPIPPGMTVCHDCPDGDNPTCVRHLWLGTKTENNADRDAKGRQARGERIGSAKYTAEVIQAIRRDHAAGKSWREIGRTYGLTDPTYIFDICRKRYWKHI